MSKSSWRPMLGSRVALVAMVWAITMQVDGQERSMGITPTLALARTMVRESGLRAYRRDDGAAIHAVIAFRAAFIYRSSYTEAVRRFTHGGPINASMQRPWITFLVPGINPRPRHFPARIQWLSGAQPHWIRTYQHALDIRRGDAPHQCEMTPHTWGDFYDARSYQRRNPQATRLDCGQTCTLDSHGGPALDHAGNPKCNFFFHHPRYARFEG
jgi:hypothetical protein